MTTSHSSYYNQFGETLLERYSLVFPQWSRPTVRQGKQQWLWMVMNKSENPLTNDGKHTSSFNLPTVVCSFSMLLLSLLYLMVERMLIGKEWRHILKLTYSIITSFILFPYCSFKARKGSASLLLLETVKLTLVHLNYLFLYFFFNIIIKVSD